VRSLLLGLLIRLALPGSSLVAQQEAQAPHPVRLWGTGGVGVSTEGFATLIGFDLAIRQHHISVRAAAVESIFHDRFWDVALLYGRAGRWSRGAAGGSVGVALMDGERCGVLAACAPVASRISLPVAARAALHLLPALGVGIYGFLNINSEQSFAGAVLTIELGRIR
jgi:hypothetical protein